MKEKHEAFVSITHLGHLLRQYSLLMNCLFLIQLLAINRPPLSQRQQRRHRRRLLSDLLYLRGTCNCSGSGGGVEQPQQQQRTQMEEKDAAASVGRRCLST